MVTKEKPTDIIFSEMLEHNVVSIAPLAYGNVLWLKGTGASVSTQILSLAAALICMLRKYGLSHIDVLSSAENIVDSDKNNNMHPAFKQIMNSITNFEEN